MPGERRRLLRNASLSEHRLQILLALELLDDLLLARLQHAAGAPRDLLGQLCVVRLLVVEAFDEKVVTEPLFDR